MAPQTSVTLDGMGRAQIDFQNALDDMNTVSNDMNEERATLASNWTGESSSQFGIALQTWLDDLDSVKQQLVSVINTLGHHTHVYARAHETATEVSNAFMKGLTGLSGLNPNAGSGTPTPAGP